MKIRLESESRVTLRDNPEVAASLFQDPSRGNLRFTARLAELPTVPRLPEASEDFDRRPRGRQTTPGAHESPS